MWDGGLILFSSEQRILVEFTRLLSGGLTIDPLNCPRLHHEFNHQRCEEPCPHADAQRQPEWDGREL